jgi:RimJ/RimL family protein N-acetyltransferase
MLDGKTFTLVPFDRRHGERTRTWANDAALGRWLDRARPVSDVEHEDWSRRIVEQRDVVMFAIESMNEHVGNVWLCDIHPRHHKAELRILIGQEAATGRGIGSEAIELVSRFGFGRLNLHKIYAYVLATNPRARRSFEKAGFVVEGVLRADRWAEDRYVDVFLLAKLALASPASEGAA